mgnify:FL=1
MKTENRHINFQEPEGMMLLRYIKDTASNEEKSYIEAWLEADENNKRILLQTARIYYANNAMERIASRNPLIAYEKLEQRLAKRTRSYWLKRFSVAAACIIAIIGLSTLFSHRKADSEFGDPQIITLQANAGVRTRFNLPDGTVVYLNSGSVLSYPMSYDQKERKVYLSGEAYFKVAQDTRPFYVITDHGTIRQYGTEFNVNTFSPERTEVALVKGSISIIPTKSSQEQFIKPGQLAHIEQKNNNISIHNVDLTPYIAWNEGRLIFENRTLENIVEILEHWYNVDISFGTSELKQLRFTGNMDRYATISPILKAIARTTNLQIKIKGREILITDN